jgi:CheY-like chemotaxis protein
LAPAKASILCVDDEENGLQLRKLVLEKSGYDVVAASSATEALEAMAARTFDLILADYVMPGISGAELAVTAKTRDPDVPVILISGINEVPADSAEADLFISKTEGPAKLIEAIEALLGQNLLGQKRARSSTRR